MKLHNECFVCLFKQALEAGKFATKDEKKIRKILFDFASKIPEINLDLTTPAIIEEIHRNIKNELGINDPYLNYKKKHMKIAGEFYPQVKNLLKNRENKIETALLMSAIGNSIDSGININVDIKNILQNDIREGFVISDINKFKKELDNSEELLIIADNSGEGYFDKILIEELKLKYNIKIYYAVRAEPILNDITLKEAREIGIDEVATLIDSGCKAPGLLLEETTEEFMNIFHNANIIISKGQGNYESLSEYNYEIYYLLKAKCEVMAREFGIKKGGLIFKKCQ